MLYRAKIEHEYERLLDFGDGAKVLPDFTITGGRETVYWEHLGMLGDYDYRRDWERKLRVYADHGITLDNGLLIASQDHPSGAINTQ
jgi:hypothetical protein